jgi:hypothetical protein
MTDKYVYRISGTDYSGLANCKGAGFIDATYVSKGGAPGGVAFVNACKAVGMSPIANCGNDGVRCPAGADPATFYKNLADMGYQAAGGESCTVEDVTICQQHLTFINYGGEGLAPNQDSYGNLGFPPSSAKGTISYIESYNAPDIFVRDDLFNAMKSARDKGRCPEVGIMIGGWMPVRSDIYIEVAKAYIKAGYKFAGFDLWWGIGTSMWGTVQKWLPAIKEMQAVFPPIDVQLKDRLHK